MTDVAKTLEALRGAIEAESADMAQQGGGSRFTVQPLPRPGLGCDLLAKIVGQDVDWIMRRRSR